MSTKHHINRVTAKKTATKCGVLGIRKNSYDAEYSLGHPECLGEGCSGLQGSPDHRVKTHS
jgi:hypothetical protein